MDLAIVQRLDDRRKAAGLYAVGVVGWFLYMAFALNQPYPAWTMLLTIPVMDSIMRWCRKR